MRVSIVLLGIVLLAALVGCDSNEVTGPGGPDPGSLESADFAVVDSEDALANVDDATLDTDMAMHAAFAGDGRHFKRHYKHPRGPGSHLGPILRVLDLDENQREEIRGLVMTHRMQIRAALEGLREANQNLIDQANAERRAIKARVEAGEISREEARELLRELNARTREAIRNNPANEPFLQAICDSRIELFAAIRQVLDDDQQALWDSWISGLPGDCVQR
jgi:Spy/CpxP family protein refolding chaperone